MLKLNDPYSPVTYDQVMNEARSVWDGYGDDDTESLDAAINGGRAFILDREGSTCDDATAIADYLWEIELFSQAELPRYAETHYGDILLSIAHSWMNGGAIKAHYLGLGYFLIVPEWRVIYESTPELGRF